MNEVKYRRALEDVANRLMDLADIIEKKDTYDAAGFLRATEKRCRRLLAGGEYNDADLLLEVKSTRRCGTCAWWWHSQDSVGDCHKGYGPTPSGAGTKCSAHAFDHEVTADANGR
jgi:hypothetical protein